MEQGLFRLPEHGGGRFVLEGAIMKDGTIYDGIPGRIHEIKRAIYFSF